MTIPQSGEDRVNQEIINKGENYDNISKILNSRTLGGCRTHRKDFTPLVHEYGRRSGDDRICRDRPLVKIRQGGAVAR